MFDDWRGMLDRVRPDACLVAIPPFAHGPFEDELIDRGIPFLVEKPVGLELTAARRIEAKIAGRGLLVGVGYNARFTAGVMRAKEVLADRTAVFVRAAVINNLARTADFAEHWWIKRARSGGQLVEQSTHHLDLIRYLLGTEVCGVQAMGVRVADGRLPSADVEDAIATHLALANGAVASLTDATVIAPLRGHTFEVFTPDLKIELSGWDRAARFVGADGPAETVRAETHNFTRQLLGFVASVRAGRLLPPLASYRDGVKALAIADAANAALTTGGTQRLES